MIIRYQQEEMKEEVKKCICGAWNKDVCICGDGVYENGKEDEEVISTPN